MRQSPRRGESGLHDPVHTGACLNAVGHLGRPPDTDDSLVLLQGPIAQKQSIAFTLADMAIEVEAIRLLVWEAAWMLDAAKDEAAKAAYLALTGAADMAMMVTDRAVQILGGHGYIRERPVERWMRNARGVASYVGLAMV